MLKAKDLRDQAIDELEATLLDIRKELYFLKNEQKMTKKLEKPHMLREKKKDIAKLLTVIREKQMATS
jgi:large subunit ribosomal protein L29